MKFVIIKENPVVCDGDRNDAATIRVLIDDQWYEFLSPYDEFPIDEEEDVDSKHPFNQFIDALMDITDQLIDLYGSGI